MCLAALSFHAPASAQVSGPPITVTRAAPSAPNIFGTVALKANLSRYADGWYRSRMDASRHPGLQQLIAPARALAPEQQIAYVQRAVHQRIRWRSDATEWGRHDYWASAAQTLDRGVGDMEDRAIVKLHALKALGFSGRDLFLTMGKDKVGGHLVILIARLGSRYYVLDDTGGAPFTTERRPEFEPMMSFGSNATWIHGRRVARRTSPSVTTAATSSVAAK